MLNPTTNIIINFAIIALIWIGGKEVFQGVISQGEVVALVNYMSQILIEMIKLANLIITLNKAVACGNRISEVFDMKPSTTSPELDSESKVENIKTTNKHVTFNEVFFRYKDASADSLIDISFEVNKGETVGIIGGTGSGKTTLINLIPRFYDASEGEVILNGKNVKDHNLIDLRERIGIVPQSSVLFQGSVRENLRVGKAGASDEEIYQALRQAQALEFVQQKSNKLDFHISQGGTEDRKSVV